MSTSTKNGSGNMTQLAIPNTSGTIYSRYEDILELDGLVGLHINLLLWFTFTAQSSSGTKISVWYWR